MAVPKYPNDDSVAVEELCRSRTSLDRLSGPVLLGILSVLSHLDRGVYDARSVS